jgi:hypothetical protein
MEIARKQGGSCAEGFEASSDTRIAACAIQIERDSIRKALVKVKTVLLLCSLLLLGACYKNGLYVQEEWVDAEFLASEHINTPDPRRADPPIGHRLLVGWDVPRSLFLLHPTLQVEVWLWDNTVQTLSSPLERRRGSEAFFFPNEKILTYRVQILNNDGTVESLWEHHLWTQLIELDTDRLSSKDSVASQPRQASVTETP